jgi:hypothetical protein
MLSRFITPVARSALPAMRAQCRNMATKVDDVKIKDLPAYASAVAKDPQTRSAFEVSLKPLA